MSSSKRNGHHYERTQLSPLVEGGEGDVEVVSRQVSLLSGQVEGASNTVTIGENSRLQQLQQHLEQLRRKEQQHPINQSKERKERHPKQDERLQEEEQFQQYLKWKQQQQEDTEELLQDQQSHQQLIFQLLQEQQAQIQHLTETLQQQRQSSNGEEQHQALQLQIRKQEEQIYSLTQSVQEIKTKEHQGEQLDLQQQVQKQQDQIQRLQQTLQHQIRQSTFQPRFNKQDSPPSNKNNQQTIPDVNTAELKGVVENLLLRIQMLEAENRRLTEASPPSKSSVVNIGPGAANVGTSRFRGSQMPLTLTEPPPQPPQDRPSFRRWKNLHKAYNETFEFQPIKKNRLVFMHPEEVVQGFGKNYTHDELSRVWIRPFPSRLFITNVNVEWNTVWLRTRHTDHHAARSFFNPVRDALKADAITRNPPAAKYALTELLNMCYSMEESRYYSFACTLASAFSKSSGYKTILNTEFETGLLLHPERQAILDDERQKLQMLHRTASDQDIEELLLQQQQTRARARLMILMDICFSKLRQKKLLVDDNKYNIYRLVNCQTKHSKNKGPYVFALFSFFFQVAATCYVALSLTPLDDDPFIAEPSLTLRNLPLAICTAGFGIMVARPEMKSARQVHRVHYGRWSWLAFMDFTVNFICPMVVTICGFFVVLRGMTFLDGVLNAVALIFITEIDDQLPSFLELDTLDIVQGYLIDEAMDEYEYQNLDGKVKPIQFSDMHITNTEESGSSADKGVTFQPYEVFGGKIVPTNDNARRRKSKKVGTSRKRVKAGRQRKMEGGDGIQVANKRSVTKDCLLRKISWQYTGGFDYTSRPRIGHLKLEKLVGDSESDDVIDIIGKQKAKPEMNRPWYSVTGVYIISSFSMSDDILRLRICGSYGADAPKNFVRAFDYYSLWPLDPDAMQKLSKVQINPTRDEVEDSLKVLFGLTPDGGPAQEERSLHWPHDNA